MKERQKSYAMISASGDKVAYRKGIYGIQTNKQYF